MEENRPMSGLEYEVAELRDEVRRLRAEQDALKNADGHGKNGKNGGKDNDAGNNEKETKEKGQDEEKQGKAESKGENEEDDKKEGDKKQDDENDPEQARKKRRRKILIIAGVIVVLIAGLIWWLHARNFEDTDDATVDGHITGLASRISGIVTNVYVDQNDFVSAGSVLVDLDPRDYQVALDQARGQFTQAQQEERAQRPNVPSTQVTNRTNIAVSDSQVLAAEQGVAAAERNYQAALEKVNESQANSAKAQTDVERYRPLVEKDEVPREQFDQVLANAKALAATVAANQQSAEAARKQVDQSRQQLAQAQQRARETEQNSPRQIAIQRASLATRIAGLESAQAQLDQAALNLQYCKIVTPVRGIVAKRMAEVGQHVAPGQQVLLITETDDLWVTANFRETQLKLMHPGQSVRIHVDALSQTFDGYVESLPAASGSVISLLPPENATGNFVKIVQRLPVRIRFKQGQPGLNRLRPGMSVEPKVRVR